LAGVSSLRWRATLRRSLLTILSLWRVLTRRRGTVLTLALWRLAVLSARRWSTVLALALGRSTILSLRWSTILTRRRLLTVPLLGRCSTVASRSAILARWGMVRLLILLVVAAVNGTEEKLNDPQIGCQIERWVGTGHLFLFIFKV
jgi:hypothetical protein